MRLIAITLLLSAASLASAQNMPGTPYAPPLNYLPNFYNRNNQPLSPYLNMFRGNNPGVNYYFGVRPGTPAGGVNAFGQAPPYNPFVGPSYGGFLQQSAQPNDGTQPAYETGGQAVILRSAGHPVYYGNQFLQHGSFQSVNIQAAGRGGQQMGPRSTTQGLGTTPPRK
ncbi:hypothetical protein BH11PLA2_BH11PLA2_36130 [soil metagenome]